MFDSMVSVVASTGYAGVAGLMFLENLFPPIPSEVIMPLAGFVAARGELNVVLVVLAGTAGSMLGALPWYFAGLWLGERRVEQLAGRYGRWLGVDAADAGQALRWFDRHGNKAVLIGRLIPGVRTLISVPAGIARMPLPVFLLYSCVGTLAWTAALAAAGFLLEAEYRRVSGYMDLVSKLVIALIVALYLLRILSKGAFGTRLRDWARRLRRDVHAVYLAARDPRVPWYAKAAAFLVVIYAVSPIDLIPDFIPVIGHLDDIVLIPLGIVLVTRLVPPPIMEEHRRTAEGSGGPSHDWRAGALVLGLWAMALVYAGSELLEHLF